MKLPPISIVNGASHVHEMLYHYGRACAEAALEAAAKECDKEFAACWTASAMSQAKEAKKCAVAIRSIKIEEE